MKEVRLAGVQPRNVRMDSRSDEEVPLQALYVDISVSVDHYVQDQLLIPLGVGRFVRETRAHGLTEGNTIAIDKLHLAVHLARAREAFARYN